MAIQALDFDPLNNGSIFLSITDPGPTPINTIGADAQITEGIRLYKYEKEKLTTYCEFRIILISIITNKCQKNT